MIIRILIAFFFSASWLFASVPAGYYYPARNAKKDQLKTALHRLSAPMKVLKYGSGEGATWQGFFYTDQNSDGSVIDMYSNTIRYFDRYKSVADMHIEHALPKSWWGGADNSAYRDLFHLYPSDGRTNQYKSNYPLGVVDQQTANYFNGISKIGNNTYTTSYTGLAFEPADEFKGDFARSYLYIATTYEHFAPRWTSPMMERTTYPVWTPWAIQLLLQWHAADPVSVKERLRQEAVYAIQGNRNPFIDFPALASYIWGSDTLSVFPFPEETEPFLLTPRRGFALDFDLIVQGDTIGRSIEVRGMNLNGELTMSLKGKNPAFLLSSGALPVQELSNGSNTPAIQMPVQLSQQNITDGIFARIVFQPSKAGTFRDTLIIEGGGLSEPFLIPVAGKASRQLMTLEPDVLTPVGATLHWIADPQATAYQLKVYTGALKAGNLILSTYVEGSSFNKAVEIFNGTASAIQLNDYALAKQSNGVGDYESVFPLSGVIAPGESVMVLNKLSTSDELKAKATFFTDSVMNFNGNDAIALLHNNLRIDAIGFFDAGPDLLWGLDKTLHRKPAVTHPSSTYRETEWSTRGTDDFSPLGNHTMEFSEAEVEVFTTTLPATTSWYAITELNPETNYHYTVSAVRPDGLVPSVNSVMFRTLSPEVPVSMEASGIGADRFVAEWESDPYTNTFELEVYTKTGAAHVTVTEPFNGVGSSGKPLPVGWTGTASGNYTSATSSGEAPPSVALRNTGEWLQTPVYPHPVSEFGFLYKWASSGTGSYFRVEALKGSDWIVIDTIRYISTSKSILSYSFSQDDGLRSFRISYANKASGNIAIDDVRVVYGSESNSYLLNQQPVTGTAFAVTNLDEQTVYYYRVRSVIGTARSGWSDEVKVTTLLKSQLHEQKQWVPRWSISAQGIVLKDIEPGSRVQVYSVMGVLQGEYSADNSPEVELFLHQHQVYIIRFVNADFNYSFKVIR